MPSTPHLLLFLSIHWMQSCGFECNHEQWGLRFRFPLLLAQLLMRSINASLLSRFDSRAFFSFYSTTLSLYLNLSLLLCPCVPSFDCSLYCDHVRVNLFVLVYWDSNIVYSQACLTQTLLLRMAASMTRDSKDDDTQPWLRWDWME